MGVGETGQGDAAQVNRPRRRRVDTVPHAYDPPSRHLHDNPANDPGDDLRKPLGPRLGLPPGAVSLRFRPHTPGLSSSLRNTTTTTWHHPWKPAVHR
ncbi:hypothetical protein Ssi03_73150 [Sphaerisporangium siamense]|nr:hypothetical protein Ssi03_73150 [Sphaerisporangium siamense]